MKLAILRWNVLAVCSLAVVLTLATPMLGQSVSTSQISGVIQDQSGAIVPNARIVLTQTDTGQVHRLATGASGSYIIPDLPAGNYSLEVSSPGFSNYLQKDIVLDVGTNPQINVKLSVGTVTQEVVVESVAATVETESTGIGQVIDGVQVVELPLNGRDPDQLIALAGATTTAVGGDLNSNKNFPTIAISVAGGLPNGVAFILDGGTHNDPFNNLNMPQPMPDALQEFKVETSALPAQYGDHAAAAVNAITKSGGNKFHGDAFEFIRNYALNAAGFFGNPNSYKDGLKRNQFGGVVGGPIIKDKLFFFGGYEGTALRAVPSNNYTQVPTTAMMNGDFSVVTSTACQSKAITLAAPFTTIGGVPNQLPAGSFSPQALAAMKFIPIAGSSSAPDVTAIATKNVHTAACGYVAVRLPGNQDQKNVIGRVDYRLSDKNSIFARYFLGINSQPIPATPTNALTENAVAQYNRDQGITLGDTYIYTQNLTNSLRLSANRIVNLRVVDPFFDPGVLGVNTFNAIPGYMALSVSGGFSVGGGTTNPGHFNSTEWQFVDDVGYIHGNHEFSFGVDYIYALMSTVNNRPANGIYSFTGSALSSNGSYGYADFFAASSSSLDSFSQGLHDLENDGQTTFALYAQDSWKPRRNLTVNYGLRWEPWTPEHNSNGHVENFSMAGFTAGTKSSIFTSAPAGLSFQGDPGQPSDHYNFGKKDIFEPRLGLIYDPFGDGKTSIRAGFGIFYDAPQMFFDTRYSNSPPFGSTIALSGVSFANPWATYNGGNDPFPALNSLSTTAPFAQEGIYVNSPLHLRPMYLEQWNLSLQRQVGSWLFGATYLGNRTVHLPTSYEADPAIYTPGNCVAGQYGLTAAGACSTTKNYNARRLLYEQNAAQGVYYSTIGQYDDGGIADYNGALLQVQRRAKVMNVVANYTIAHCLSEAETTELTGPSYQVPPAVDPTGRRQSYSNCDSDRRQVANVSLILNSPHFANHITDLVASGWELSTIFTATTGGFNSVTTGTDTSLTGTGTAYAINPTNPFGSRTNFGTVNYLATQSSFTSPATGTYGPQRPLTIVGPSSYELDMSLSRTFTIHESQKVQFRWEAFNVPNEVILSGIGGNSLTSSTFGQFTSAGNPRIQQAALKYLF
jgi:hypothetical protein